MSSTKEIGRRKVLVSGVGLILGASATGLMAAPAAAIDPEKGVTAPEDLMKEHGVLNRCLLIYEEGIRRIEVHQDVPADVFQQTAQIIQKFVEDYHEKNEENY